MAGFSFRSFGLRLGLKVTDPSVLERLAERLPHGSRPSKARYVEHMFSVVVGRDAARQGRFSSRSKLRRYHMLYSGPTRIIRTLDFDELLETFESRVRLVVAEFARGRVFVHAGVVGWRGRAILIPGSSFSGKTSLVEALVRRGATYYSDEFAVLDTHGRVHPFLKPLSIREHGETRQRDVSVEEIGGRSGRTPLLPGVVVVTEFKEGARWRPQQLTPGRTALSLLEHTVPARSNPAFVFPVLERVASRTVAFKGRRGDADDTARAILELGDRILG